MRVDPVVRNLEESVKALIRGMDNKLTASENFAPEGTTGQVLTSNGPNVPPSYKSIEDTVLTILRDQGLIV